METGSAWAEETYVPHKKVIASVKPILLIEEIMKYPLFFDYGRA
ncbi:hypothetical protein [Azospirillum brasilense]|nr:hypothetical protein [Azospirillum brasilense]